MQTYEDLDALEVVLGCFYEALRLYRQYIEVLNYVYVIHNEYLAPGYLLWREATDDVLLALPRRDGSRGFRNVIVRKGTQVILDIIGSGAS